MAIQITKPLFGPEESEAVARVLASGWVTQGPEVAAFESDFARCVGSAYACAVSNCTTALHLALRAVGVGAGDEVITVSHSFIATANAIRYLDAIPVFADVQPGTCNIDPSGIEERISEKTRAILVVHQLGMPCDLEAVLEIARRNSVPLIEDAACACGSEILWNGQWEKIGRPHGDIACFSFHPRKLLTTGDGGMLTTANPELDRLFRLWRQHGMSVPDLARHSSKKVIFESYPDIGYNYRMTDIQAAVGRIQLTRLDEIVSRRRELAETYHELLAGLDLVSRPVEPEWARSNWQSYCVMLHHDLDQYEVMQYMLDHDIPTRRGVMCSHREPAYRDQPWTCGPSHSRCDREGGSCPPLANSEAAQDRGIILPLSHDMTREEQERVVETLSLACARTPRRTSI